ncbi:MAG: ABC transporter ATP-binding protein, partial [Candidatus Moranbacteria bacterium]|nr:ABC transporter ATP-binding protein [Candidatus Moranbacteria bacterium]
MVEVNNLNKYYGSFPALRNVNFEVSQGQVVGLLGPNGAGKTTTMKIMTCFMPQCDGSVLVNGFDTRTHPVEVRSSVGYLPETNPLYHDMTVAGFLDFACGLRNISKADRKRAIGQM